VAQTISDKCQQALQTKYGTETAEAMVQKKFSDLNGLLAKEGCYKLLCMENNIEVDNMTEETKSMVGKLIEFAQQKSKGGKSYGKMKFEKQEGGTLTGNCWDEEVNTAAVLENVYTVKYTDNVVGDRTYHNVTGIIASDVQIETTARPQQSNLGGFASGSSSKAVDWGKREKDIAFAGCRNNATELIAAVVSTCKDPEEAKTVLSALIQDNIYENLIKSLYNEDQRIRKEVVE